MTTLQLDNDQRPVSCRSAPLISFSAAPYDRSLSVTIAFGLVLSDEFEQVSTRTVDLSIIRRKVDATRREQRFGSA